MILTTIRSGSTQLYHGVVAMAMTLKEQCILNEWAMVVDNAAGNVQTVLNDIEGRLEESQIPGNCKWEIKEVKSEGFWGRVRRDFLFVSLKQFSDYHMYIGIRDYGAHLDCCRFLTLEPGFLKRWASEKLTGYEDELSVPKNILVEQDLRAWTTVVHHSVLDSIEALMKKLGKDTKLLRRRSKGYLDIW